VDEEDLTSTDESELAQVAAFRTQLRRFLRRTDVVTSQAGLTTQRYDLLLMLKSADHEGRGVRLTDLCELLQLQQTAVTELVKRSEQAGLVDRRPSADDGRLSLLRLTAEGERRLLQVFNGLRHDRQTLGAAFKDLDELFQAASR
jgi:DNA-binding MarR family transcriptional regulator